MTTNAKRKRSASDDDPDLQHLNARLDRIYSQINPITPYRLTVPTIIPVDFTNKLQRSVWTKGTPFAYDEGELQYISNFAEWPSTLIQAVGDWDDGKGGLKRKSPLHRIPKEDTPQQAAAKKVKLDEYLAKKHSDGVYTPPTKVELKQRVTTMKYGNTIGRQSDGTPVKTAPMPRKRSRDPDDPPPKASSLAPAEKKPKKSPMPEDTNKPTLPPPMTPLPDNLREALAEYKKQQKRDAANEKPVSVPEPKKELETKPTEAELAAKEPDETKQPPQESKKTRPRADTQSKAEPAGQAKEQPKDPEAPKQASTDAKKGLKAKSEQQQAQPAGTATAPKKSLIIKLQFRKRRADVARLLKLPSRPHSHGQKTTKSELAAHSSRTPEPTSMAANNPTPRTSSPVANRTAVNGHQSASASFADLEKSWNALAVDLKKRSEKEDLRQSRPREAFATFVAAIVAFIVQATIKAHYRPSGDSQVMSVWDGAAGAVKRFRENFKPGGCELMEGLLWHLESIMLREAANCRKNSAESAEKLRTMGTCLANSGMVMNPEVLEEDFPRTWAGVSAWGFGEADKLEQVLKKPLDGPYTMSAGLGSALENARAARLMVIEWCERQGLSYADDLGRLGGV